MRNVPAKPFIKWAGGKGQLLQQFAQFYPSALWKGEISRYIEPFLGGGAVFFDLVQKYKIKRAYLSDTNRDLVLTYRVIQQQPEGLLDFLEQFQKEYDATQQEERNNLFLSVRKHFNIQRFEINYKKFSDNWVPRAAQLIFLNKTCFNGLFRLNSKGEFNVPYGQYKTAMIFDPDNILAVSKALSIAEIIHADYTACLDYANECTFVYFDPPYRPLNKTSGFTTYTGAEFTDTDQLNLAQFFRKLDVEKHAKLMLSNSDPNNENPNDVFFDQAYAGYNLLKVMAGRAINSNGLKRGKITELLITNYPYEPRTLAFNF
ncbi:modification methylase [Sphingobacteriales bacterium UPWRP_1]|nr:modification methylase [Sphingobacteriales bacterium TSM_CSM]PSJ76333.1 modification methylase [Sphingobacteriales bacterium UPWRP_1]